MFSNKSLAVILLLASVSPMASQASWGQDAGVDTPGGDEAEQRAGLQEIVVTAQRRSENLQDVPIAVSAVTSDQLAQSGVEELTDLKLAVPTLNLTNSNGYLTSSLRGIGSNATGPGIENPVATYIDGVYYGSPAASLLSLNNVQQVEVLKGPQGTLFGRNATGGLIQVTTRDPSHSPTAAIDISYGSFQTVNANAYVSGGISDTVAGDIAVHYLYQGEGWGDNLATGTEAYRMKYDFAARSKWLFEPSDATIITIIGDYAKSRGSMNAFRTMPGTINGFNPARGAEPDYGWDANSNYPSYTTSEGGGGSLKWDQSLGDLEFMSLTAYRKSVSHINFDYDGTEENIADILTTQRDRQFSQELQLGNSGGGALTWIVGAYYFDARSGYDPAQFNFYADGAIVSIYARQKTRSYAGYAQATYAIGPMTNVTLGGRYTSEKRETYGGRIETYIIPLDLQLPDTLGNGRKASFDKFTFRASLDHRFSDEVLAYASMNRGFKSGGFNTANIDTDPYRPEQLDAYEVGLKTDLFGRDLRLNIAGFYYDYSDIQIQLLNQGSIGIINAGSAEVYGIDADFQAMLGDHFRLSGGVGWISPKFTDFPACQIGSPQGGVPVTTGSCAGNQIPLASKFVGNLSANYELEFADDSAIGLNTTFYYNSGFFTESDNVIEQGDYALIGASATYTLPGGQAYLTAFGKNLGDVRVINFASTIPNGTQLGFHQAPRTYGVTIGYKY